MSFIRKHLLRISLIAILVSFYINTHAVLFNAGGMGQLSYSPLLIMTSLLNVIFFIYLVKIILNNIMKKHS